MSGPLTMSAEHESWLRVNVAWQGIGPGVASDCVAECLKEIDALRSLVSTLTARVEEAERDSKRYETAIRWALGEGDDFPEYPGPFVMASGMSLHRYWYWRDELRQRAALDAASKEKGND